jgi:hypothetical protein
MRRLKEIIILLNRAKARGAKLVGKTPLERERDAWINGPVIECEPIDWEPGPIKPIPEPYELNAGFSADT